MSAYALDLSGQSSDNKIIDEPHNFGSASDRLFTVNEGPFFVKSVEIRDSTTDELLRPVTDYMLYHFYVEASKASTQEVAQLVYISNPDITGIKITYQVIGGIYGGYEATLSQLLGSFDIAQIGDVSWGSVINKPNTFFPAGHIHSPYDITGWNKLVASVNRLIAILVAGDRSQFAAVYQYIRLYFQSLLDSGDLLSNDTGDARYYQKTEVDAIDNNTRTFLNNTVTTISEELDLLDEEILSVDDDLQAYKVSNDTAVSDLDTRVTATEEFEGRIETNESLLASGGRIYQVLSQADYDTLAVKEPGTLYVIAGEP